MELDKIIPKSSGWIIKDDTIFFHKYVNIPVCYVINDIAYIYLDNSIQRRIIEITKNLIKLGITFYFTNPSFSNPKFEIDNYSIIKHYLFSYIQKDIHYGFKKIGFDLIKNMIEWVEWNKCFYLLKDIFGEVEAIVNSNHFDYYTNRLIFNYDEEIRDDFKTLYRDIQISRLFVKQ